MTDSRRWLIAAVAVFGFLSSACSFADISYAPPQPISIVVVVTATFTPTPTPTQTPLPRELVRDDPDNPGWAIVSGRPLGVWTTSDFLYEARFKPEEWTLEAGPSLRLKSMPECLFVFDDVPYQIQPQLFDARPSFMLTPQPAATWTPELAVARMRHMVFYTGGSDVDLFSCRDAAQAVLDTMLQAPPSPGFVPTPTFEPPFFVYPDGSDARWYWVRAGYGDWGKVIPRIEMRFPRILWIQQEHTLVHTRVPGCRLLIVPSKGGDPPGASTLILSEAMRQWAEENQLAVRVEYSGNESAGGARCLREAQQVADTARIAQN